MGGLKFLVELVFGNVIVIGGAIVLVLVIGSVTWDAVSAVVYWIRVRIFGPIAPEPVEPAVDPDSRRSLASRERHAARIEARRAALRAKHDSDAVG
ncbi:hypothetical protein AB0L62_27330 [Nocardia asteroides]|uniref:hypothetical protein n=1 Tax=Nocardia asteroides TaxID=1824 RepID=UPI00344516E8